LIDPVSTVLLGDISVKAIRLCALTTTDIGMIMIGMYPGVAPEARWMALRGALGWLFLIGIKCRVFRMEH
jgi:hypothetical protein